MGKVESALVSVLQMLKLSMQDYCELETIDDGHILVSSDGSCASIVQFHGSKSIMNEVQLTQLFDLLTNTLSIFLKEKGHQIQVLFRRDLDGRASMIRNAEQQAATAHRLKLDVYDLIDETVERYSNYVYEEECYLVFWSRPALLDRMESKIHQEETNVFRKKSKWHATGNAQNLLRPISFLRDRHNAFVSQIFNDLSSSQFNCYCEILNVVDALRTIRASVYPDLTGPQWEPSIPKQGMTIPLRWKENDKIEDISEFLYPRLAEQIMTATADVGTKNNPHLPDPTTIRVATRIYAPLYIKYPPRKPKFFNHLFVALNRTDTTDMYGRKRSVPFCLSIMLEGDGFDGTTLKNLFSTILSFTSQTNQNIKHAFTWLAEQKHSGKTIVKLRLAAMTWAENTPEGIRELRIRKSKLARILEGWGDSTVTEQTGYVMDAFQTCCIGLTPKSNAPACPAPLKDALSILPLTRPTSPFPTGSLVYCSRDGKTLFYQPFSSLQTTWITLIAGRPGYGKSVLLNWNNFEKCIMPGITKLPYIGIIDIGISSSGFIDLVKDSLPENLTHLAVYKRLQNSENDCINPMDTPLTLREPLRRGREFLKNFITTIVTPPERDGRAYEGMSNFVGRIVDLAYLYYSDTTERSRPKKYRSGHIKVIDDAVEKLNIFIKPATTYWELADAFFRAEMYYEAEVAQRYAVPTLNDLVGIAASEEIASEYSDAQSDGGRKLIDTFQIGIREAINDYPIFSDVTRFDLGSARIVSLDLQDVAMIGSAAAHKQTSLMFMIARESFMKKVAYSKEDLPAIKKEFAIPYYTRLINDLVDEYKVLCMDEFHKTGGHPILRLQVLTDGRESRKWNLALVFASQLMEDFGQELVKIATTHFILDAGTADTRKWMREYIGLTDVEEQGLLNFANGPTQDGATFLARFSTKSATFSQLFTLMPGAIHLWALSTTAEDRKLRILLYAKMPHCEARKLLARTFPSGSCKRYVERRKAEGSNDAVFDDDKLEATVIEKISEELLDQYNNNDQV